MFTDSLGKKNFLRDERHEQYRAAVPPLCPKKKTGAKRKLTSTRSDVNLFQRRNVTSCPGLRVHGEFYYSLIKIALAVDPSAQPSRQDRGVGEHKKGDSRLQSPH